MHTIILANGTPSAKIKSLPAHDLLLAADGGARLALAMGLTPDVVIGDLDSLSPEEVARFERQGTTVLRHPPAKDETDLELALDHAKAQGASEITLFGLLGGRWDMTFANLLLLAAPKYEGISLQVVAGKTELFILRGGETKTLQGTRGDVVSVLPLGGEARGVTYRGLSWPLENAALPFGSPRGVSNSMAGEAAQVSLRTGVVLIAHQR